MEIQKTKEFYLVLEYLAENAGSHCVKDIISKLSLPDPNNSLQVEIEAGLVSHKLAVGVGNGKLIIGWKGENLLREHKLLNST